MGGTEKGKPVERRGRKATGLNLWKGGKLAGLPRESQVNPDTV